MGQVLEKGSWAESAREVPGTGSLAAPVRQDPQVRVSPKQPPPTPGCHTRTLGSPAPACAGLSSARVLQSSVLAGGGRGEEARAEEA